MKIASSINPDLYFTSLYDVVLSKVLATLSNGYRSVDDYMDREKSFTDKLYEMTSLKVTLIKKILNHNYPPLCSVSMWVHSGDLSTMKSHGSDLIKAKAELLERLSAAVPLDMIKSPDFLIKGVYEQVKDKKIKIKSIINNDTLSRGMGELYYYFGKYNNIDSVYNVDNKSDNCDIINYNKDQSIYIKNKKTQMTTNGCAGHFDYDKAVCAGWLEYIQRDGFLMYWLNSISPKVIDVDAYYLENTNSESSKDIRSNKDISKILLDLKKYNLEYYFLDITSDIAIPNVLCVIVVEVDGIKRLQMGAGTGFDADAALLSAALEAMAGAGARHDRRPNLLEFNVKTYQPFTDKSIDQNARQDMYYHKDMIKYIDFIYKSKEIITVEDWMSVSAMRGFDIRRLSSDTKYQLEYLKRIFKEKIDAGNNDYNVYVYEFKNKLIKYFDFKAVKVICPALYGLYLREDFADPLHPRLAEFIKNKGLENKAKINIWPHPFP